MSSSSSPSRAASFWDRVGIGISGVCVVHCALTPIVLALLPLWPRAIAFHAWMHPVLAALLLPITFLAWRAGQRKGAGPDVTRLLAAGLVFVLAAMFLHDVLGPFGEAAGTTLGSILLVAGHLRNWRFLQTCRV